MFFNNCNWCRCWTRCENKCCHHQKKDNNKYEEKKCCHLEQSNSHKDCGCKPVYNHDRFESQNFDFSNYGYSDFRYYDQYGAFNKFEDDECKYDKKPDNNYACKCDKKECKDDKYYCYKPCKPSYDKCQPTKFVCFPIDKY